MRDTLLLKRPVPSTNLIMQILMLKTLNLEINWEKTTNKMPTDTYCLVPIWPGTTIQNRLNQNACNFLKLSGILTRVVRIIII